MSRKEAASAIAAANTAIREAEEQLRVALNSLLQVRPCPARHPVLDALVFIGSAKRSASSARVALEHDLMEQAQRRASA